MFFHFRLYGLRCDVGVKCSPCVFILVWSNKNDPICKNIFVLVFRLEWKNSEDKTGKKTGLRVKTLIRKF